MPYLASARGRITEWEQYLTSALKLHEANGDVQRSARARANLADLHNTLGSFEDAERALRRAIEDCRRVGNRASEGWAMLNLGIALTGRENWEEAVESLRAARAIGRDAPHASLEASALLCLARLYVRRGELVEADTCAEEACRFSEANGLHTRQASALAVLSAARLGRADPGGALEASTRAMTIRDEAGGLADGEAELFLSHGRALAASGREDEARAAYARGRQVVAEQALGITNDGVRDQFLSAPINQALMEAS